MKITCNLFGNTEIWKNEEKINFPFKKAEGLFYYMLMEKEVSRDILVNLLWSENTEESAKKNLRNAIYMIKKTFGFDILYSPVRSQIVINNEVDIEIDVEKFLSGDIDAYKGEFLYDFFVKDSENYETWQCNLREHFKDKYISSLYEKLNNLNDESQIELYCKRILEEDEFDEVIYRKLLRVYAKSNRFNKCIELYGRLQDVLKKELGITPDVKTTELYEKIIEQKSNKKDQVSKMSEGFYYARTNEMSILKTNLEYFREELNSKSILILGEAGSGKTEILSRISSSEGLDFLVIRTSCFQDEARFQLKPWDNIIKQLSTVIKSYDMKIGMGLLTMLWSVFPSLLEEFGSEADNQMEKLDFIKSFVIDKAIYELLELISQKKKIIILIDDIHWIDGLSLSIVKSIINNNKNKRITFFMCSRNENTELLRSFENELKSNNQLDTIFLDRLTYQETFNFASTYLNRKLEDEFVQKLYDETEGNILFMKEYLDSVKTMSNIAYKSRIKDIVINKYFELTKEAQKIIDMSSVFIGRIDFNIILDMSEIGELTLIDVIEELIDKNLLYEREDLSGTLYYEFTHNKYKEIINNNLSLSKRKIISKRIAEVIEKNLRGDLRDRVWYSKLINYYKVSGDRFKEIKFRILYLNDFLELNHETFPIINYKEILNSQDYKLTNEDIDNEFEQLSLLFDDVIVTDKNSIALREYEMQFLLISGRYYIKLGEYKKGHRDIDKLISKATAFGNDSFIVKGLIQKIFYCINIHDLDEMISYINKSKEILDGIEEYQMAMILRLEGLYYILIGDYAKGRTIINEALKMFKGFNNKEKYLLNIAACYYYLGECNRYQDNQDKAVYYYKKSIKMCEDNNLIGRLTVFYTHAGHALFDKGDYIESKIYFEKAYELYKTYDFRWGKSTAAAFLSLLYSYEGRQDLSLILLQDAKGDSKKLNNPYEMGIITRVEVEIYKYLIESQISHELVDITRTDIRKFLLEHKKSLNHDKSYIHDVIDKIYKHDEIIKELLQ